MMIMQTWIDGANNEELFADAPDDVKDSYYQSQLTNKDEDDMLSEEFEGASYPNQIIDAKEDLVVVKVRFSEDSPIYSYIAPRKWVDGINSSSRILVPVSNWRLGDFNVKVVKCAGVGEVKDLRPNIPYKYIIGIVDKTMIDRYTNYVYQFGGTYDA